MKLQLSTLAILGSFVAFAHGVCIKTSGNGHNIPETGDTQVFALVYNNGELVCSMDRSSYEKGFQLDCHDGHYAIIPNDFSVLMYAHDKVDYRVPLKPDSAGIEAVAWNAQQGC